jgi:CHAD domain-containing protein
LQNIERTFADLVQQVQERYALTPIYTSKLVRGLESLITQIHNNLLFITATMELEAAGRLLIHQQLLQILLNEHGVRAGTKAKYVHDMRVAIRRARAALQLCESALGAKGLAPFKKGLRKLGGALGAVRDLDIALINLRDFKRSQPKSHHKAIKRLRKELKSQRALAHSKLTKLLDSKGYRKFIEALVNYCVTPNSAGQVVVSDPYEITPTQVRHTLPSILLHAFERMRAYEVLFSGSNLPPLESIHAMRIESKSVRYLLEFSKHLMGNEGEILLKQLRDFQEHLGQLNDAHVEEQRLSQWAESMSDEALSTDAIATRLHETRAHINKLVATVPARLDSLIRPSTRKKLALALAHI